MHAVNVTLVIVSGSSKTLATVALWLTFQQLIITLQFAFQKVNVLPSFVNLLTWSSIINMDIQFFKGGCVDGTSLTFLTVFWYTILAIFCIGLFFLFGSYFRMVIYRRKLPENAIISTPALLAMKMTSFPQRELPMLEPSPSSDDGIIQKKRAIAKANKAEQNQIVPTTTTDENSDDTPQQGRRRPPVTPLRLATNGEIQLEAFTTPPTAVGNRPTASTASWLTPQEAIAQDPLPPPPQPANIPEPDVDIINNLILLELVWINHIHHI